RGKVGFIFYFMNRNVLLLLSFCCVALLYDLCTYQQLIISIDFIYHKPQTFHKFAVRLNMISPQTIQQITSRIDIIDVIGEYIKLKKRGANYLGLCPFHGEKTPSFTVSPSKEIYKCFGCGKSGNTITFLMEHEKYSYVEALRWLANRYNVVIEETEVSNEVKQQQQAAESLYIINNFAQQFFSKILFETEEGRDVGLSYLKERGFREDIIKKFQLGFNPEARDSFTKAAIGAQYNTE